MGRNVDGRRHLTPREAEVLVLVCEGWSAREIGAALHIAPGTVEKYVAHAMETYQARNRANLVARAIADGLI
ncbi:response regulator transcription factor [Sphingomonas sp. M6A6_1c]